MIDFNNKVITIVGRLAAASAETVETVLMDRGGTLRRGQPRRDGVLVISPLAFRQLDSGSLRCKLRQADQAGARCLSEAMFLEALGLLGPRPDIAGVIDLDDLPTKTGLDLETLRFLILFDIIQTDGKACSFRDLVAAREVARLLGEGISLGHIIEGVRKATLSPTDREEKPAALDQPLARLKLISDEYGHIVNRIGDVVADLDGQMRLPLPDADNPTIDELFEAAEEAEWLGELSVAKSLYRRCIRLDRQDPIAPFNLANVMREQGDTVGAVFYLRLALGLDSHFPDAWYNLALLMDGRGEREAAKEGFERAIEADAQYADPVYNLAQLHFDDGRYEQAARLWARYLVLDPDSEWSRRARYGLALCRRQEDVGC